MMLSQIVSIRHPTQKVACSLPALKFWKRWLGFGAPDPLGCPFITALEVLEEVVGIRGSVAEVVKIPVQWSIKIDRLGARGQEDS